MAVRAEWRGAEVLTEMETRIMTGLEAIGLEVEGRVKENLVEMEVTASGAAGLLGSFATKVTKAGPGVFTMSVESTRPYSAYVEFGTRPHWPPIRPLYEWVEKKLDIVDRANVFDEGDVLVRQRVIRQFGTRRAAARWQPQRRYDRFNAIMKIARAVQRAIGRRGTRPRYYMRRALESMGLPFQEGAGEAGTYGYRIDATEMLARRMGLR